MAYLLPLSQIRAFLTEALMTDIEITNIITVMMPLNPNIPILLRKMRRLRIMCK